MTTMRKFRRLTLREWRAIAEALNARLAGEIDVADEPDTPDEDDYRRALAKVQERTHGQR
jgi:hypothetical protein